MSDKEELSKIDLRRRQRDKRVEALKTKDGGKKRIQTSSRLGRVLFPVVSVALVLAFALWLGFTTGFVQSMLKPVQIGSDAVSMKEFTYHYREVLNTYQSFVAYGMAPADASGRLDLTALCSMPGYEDKTWKEYIIDQTIEQIKNIRVTGKVAAEKGYSFGEEDQKTLDAQIEAIKKNFPTEAEQNKVLQERYGQGVDLNYYLERMKQLIVNQRFSQDYPKTYAVSEDEIAAYYEENRESMDVVTYRQFVFSLKGDEADEAAKEAKQESNRELATAMLNAVSDGESFRTAAIEYAEPDQKASYVSEDLTLSEDVKSSYVANADVKAWLFDSARQPGDKTQLTSGESEYVLYFEGRRRLENHMPSVRHILIGDPNAAGSPDEAQLEKDKLLAEELAAKIKSEADMIAESEAMTAAGTTREATLIENIGWKTMDSAFHAWIFDAQRRPGDVGVVKTAYGYHVVYFVGLSEESEWVHNSKSALQAKKFSEDMKAWLEEERFAVTRSAFALRYVE